MSQIANVIQSGGEDGMWNFDRYSRWMEQKKDWVRSEALAGESVPAASSPPAAIAPQAPARGSISVEEVKDIEELAELARQVEKRSSSSSSS
jgi:hypothetical protein